MMVVAMLACTGTSTGPAAVSIAPEAIDAAQCAVCGMVVGEQPSPRGQLAYRDGSHDHVCSIEELRALAGQPSAKGRPTALYVEVLPETFDVASVDTDLLPWKPVGEAWFVFGASRHGVMGEPVLSFATASAAARYADALGSTPLPWSALEQTPFHAIPPDAGISPSPSP